MEVLLSPSSPKRGRRAAAFCSTSGDASGNRHFFLRRSGGEDQRPRAGKTNVRGLVLGGEQREQLS